MLNIIGFDSMQKTFKGLGKLRHRHLYLRVRWLHPEVAFNAEPGELFAILPHLVVVNFERSNQLPFLASSYPLGGLMPRSLSIR